MKKIVLVRHAEALSRKAGVPDRQRPLLRGGVQDARSAAKYLRRNDFTPDLIVSSPADRALETAHLLAEGLGYPLDGIRIEPALYTRDEVAALLEIVAQAPAEADSLLICGHDPQFSAAAGLLSAGFAERLSKGAALGLEADVAAWPDFAAAAGRVFLYHTPLDRQERKRLYREARRGLARRLAGQLEAELATIDPAAAAEARGAALRAAARVVDRFLERAHKRDLLFHHRLRGRASAAGDEAAAGDADRDAEPREGRP